MFRQNSYYATHSDDYSATASFGVKRHLALDVRYSRWHLDTLANLWVEEPANISIVVSVPGYVAEYIRNIYTVSILRRLQHHTRCGPRPQSAGPRNSGSRGVSR